MSILRLTLITLAALVIAGCGTPSFLSAPTPTPTCGQQSAAFLAKIEPLAREWDDANTLANSTQRASLSAQIEKLQSIRRRAQDLEAPPCAFLVRQKLVDAMDSTIQGYIAFLGQQPDATVKGFFDQAKQSMDAFQAEMLNLGTGAVETPTPMP